MEENQKVYCKGCKFLKAQNFGFRVRYCDNPKKRFKENFAYDYKIVYPFIHEKEGNRNNDCTMFERAEVIEVSKKVGFFRMLIDKFRGWNEST